MEGNTMEIKNRFRLLWGISLFLNDLQETAVRIKYTKTRAVIMSGNRRYANNFRKIFQLNGPVSILFKTGGGDCVKTPGMGMSRKAHGTVGLLHPQEMGTKFLGPGKKTFVKPGQVRACIMAKENTIPRRGKNLVCRQRCQESDLLLAVSRIQVLIMGPMLHIRTGGLFREDPGSIEIVVPRYNDLASLPDKIQAGWCISLTPVTVIGVTESGNIAQADDFITSLLINLLQNLLQVDKVLVYI
jgi:hypothetical protein